MPVCQFFLLTCNRIACAASFPPFTPYAPLPAFTRLYTCRPECSTLRADNKVVNDQGGNMVAAIGSGGAVSAATGGSSGSSAQIAALQKQITAAQKKLTESQKGEQTEASQKLQQQLAQQIRALQAQIAQLQAAAAQQAAQQDAPPAGSADTATGPARSSLSTLGSIIDTQA
ncbi:hypothetical protein CSQ90_22080 [Janthinobacterium sp. BJB303]|nr:hypothetical protein CSQ90_22080 [Janthinobacterium sp. BJB303]